MKHKVPLILACSFFIVNSAIFAASLNVSNPKDRSIIMGTRAQIYGNLEGISSLSINKTPVPIEPGGKFTAVSLLDPGKNLLDITARTAKGEVISKSIRLLKIVTFDDLEKTNNKASHWAKSPVLFLSTAGIIEGYPDNNFYPEKAITRGELATWIARAKGLKVSTPQEDIFYDVPKEHWRAPFIKAVIDSGIMSGLSNDTFGIDTQVQRSEATAIFARAFSIKEEGAAKAPFLDVASATDNAPEISAAYRKGLVVGVKTSEKIFEPERNMKRAEAAILISRLNSMKTLRAALYDFSQGYTPERYGRISTRPVIKSASITPNRSKADGRTPVTISMNVDDAQGKEDISQVWADLTPVLGPNNAKMNEADNGSYELNIAVSGEVKPGDKAIMLHALDKSGLKSDRVVKFTVTGK